MAERGLEAIPDALRAALLEAIREIQVRGIDVTLVGGLAVNLLGSAISPSSGRLDDPSLLAGMTEARKTSIWQSIRRTSPRSAPRSGSWGSGPWPIGLGSNGTVPRSTSCLSEGAVVSAAQWLSRLTG